MSQRAQEYLEKKARRSLLWFVLVLVFTGVLGVTACAPQEPDRVAGEHVQRSHELHAASDASVVVPPGTLPDPVPEPLPLACKVEPRRLHVDEDFEACLYAWMETLAVKDFVIPAGRAAYIHWDGTHHDTDHLYNLWLTHRAWATTHPADEVFTAAPEWFVLDDGAGRGIEGSDTLRYGRWGNYAAHWTQVDMPNAGGSQANPFYKSRALCNRALVVTIVDMIESDYYHDARQNPWGQSANAKDNARFLGGLMNYWTQVYTFCGEAMPDPARAAFEAALVHHMDKLYEQGAGFNTPNMASRAVGALGSMYHIAGRGLANDTLDASRIKERALASARRYMFGSYDGAFGPDARGLIFPAGYFQEGGSPETTYGGVTFNHTLEALGRTGYDPAWHFLDPAMEAYLDWRTHQLFVEPSGLAYGPSGYAGRTGAGVEGLQARDRWVEHTAASRYGRRGLIPQQQIQTPGKMVRHITGWLTRKKTRNKYFDSISTGSLPHFNLDNKHHWPAAVPYYPPAGTYRMLARSEPVQLPVVRRGYYYNRSFADDFWMVKSDGGFAFVVETEADGGRYSGYRGGSLQAFWTAQGGVFLMARHNKSSNTRRFSEVENWPTHHVWGRQEGRGFSTANIQHRDVAYYGATDSVSVGGTVAEGEQEVMVPLSIENRFVLLDDGLRLRHVITPDAPVEVDELWLTLPVHLRLCKGAEVTRNTRNNNCGVPDARIEYWTGSAWSTLPETLVQADSLRITRNWSYIGGAQESVTVSCGDAVAVKAGPLWQQTYQGSSRIVPVHIRLSAGGSLPGRTAITCDVKTTE